MIQDLLPPPPGGMDDEPARRRPPTPDERRRPHAVPLPVTSLAVARAQVERQLAQSRRHRSTLAVLRVVVEEISDGGDPVPAADVEAVCDDVALRLRSRIRATDRVVRIGTHEACAMLIDGAADCAPKVAARLVRAIEGVYQVGERSLRVRVAIGHAAHPEQGTSANALVEAAAPARKA